MEEAVQVGEGSVGVAVQVDDAVGVLVVVAAGVRVGLCVRVK